MLACNFIGNDRIINIFLQNFAHVFSDIFGYGTNDLILNSWWYILWITCPSKKWFLRISSRFSKAFTVTMNFGQFGYCSLFSSTIWYCCFRWPPRADFCLAQRTPASIILCSMCWLLVKLISLFKSQPALWHHSSHMSVFIWDFSIVIHYACLFSLDWWYLKGFPDKYPSNFSIWIVKGEASLT